MENLSALGAARRHWWIILLMAGLGAVLGALPAPQRVEDQAVRYNATHTMLLNDFDQAPTGSSGVSPSQVSFFATTGEVPERVAERIGYPGSPDELASQVTVDFDFEVGALRVSTTQEVASQAEAIADAFAEELNTYLAERQDAYYVDRLAASDDRLAELKKKIDDLTTQKADEPDNNVIGAQIEALNRRYSVAYEQNTLLSEAVAPLAFTTVERAHAVASLQEGLAAPTSRATRGAMGLLVGAALGLGIAMLVGIFDRRIRTLEQAEELLGLRTRVQIPTSADAGKAGLVVAHGRQDPLSDSYRTMRNVVAFVHEGLELEHRARITLVVSPGPGEGKTSLAANLAAAFAETGRHTIAVNTDFRRPRLTRAITGEAPPRHPFDLEHAEHLSPRQLLWETNDPDLSILDLSKLGEAGDLARTTARLVPTLSRWADDIVIDTSPVGSTAEVLDLVPVADVIVIVVRLGHTQADVAKRAVGIIRDLTTVPLLLVLTGTKASGSSYYQYTDRRRPQTSGRSWRHPFRKPYTGPERRRVGLRAGGPEQRAGGADGKRRADDRDPQVAVKPATQPASGGFAPRLLADPGLAGGRQSERAE
jgi:tyrosine-protein kinase Etk/Wzc